MVYPQAGTGTAPERQDSEQSPDIPWGDTEPPGGTHEHPEDIGETPSDEQGAEDVTES
jgi:hypothetical protein